MTTKAFAKQFKQTRQLTHPGCVVCSENNEQGLKLDFDISADGTISADFKLDTIFEGYPGRLHGGVLCTILDGAMTNCLFAHDYIAVTADFHVRFRHPVVTDEITFVRAWINRSSSCLYELKAEIIQNAQTKTTATGKFIKQPQLDRTVKA